MFLSEFAPDHHLPGVRAGRDPADSTLSNVPIGARPTSEKTLSIQEPALASLLLVRRLWAEPLQV